MSAIITCSICGQRASVADRAIGRMVKCPHCDSPIVAGSAASPASGRPADPQAALQAGSHPLSSQIVPSSRTVLANPEEVIRYGCPRCQKSLESPASLGGTKLTCPGCGQRLQIPLPPTPPAPPPINKTVLAVSASGGQPQQPQPVVHQPEVLQLVPTSIVRCLECGRELLGQPPLACPDCASLFCSSACCREHRAHAHEGGARPRGAGFQCPYCGTTALPYRSGAISAAGWTVFALMILIFFPLCWIGLLIKEEYRRCAACGMRLG